MLIIGMYLRLFSFFDKILNRVPRFFSCPSACGKTTFLKEVLGNGFEEKSKAAKPVKRLIIFYRHWQRLYNEIADSFSSSVIKRFIAGFDPSVFEDGFWDFKDGETLLILDDVMGDIIGNKRNIHLLNDIATVYSHHSSCTVLVLLQTPFWIKELQTFRSQLSYYVIFNSPQSNVLAYNLQRWVFFFIFIFY